MKRLLLVLVSLVMFGCQSKADAVRIVCESPGAVGQFEAAQRLAAIEQYLHENIKNQEVLGVLLEMKKMDVKQQIQVMKGLQKEANISHCPLLDVYAVKARMMR